ncbi:Kinesin-like protein KIF2C [Hibiscus syriacus]|uniref:Kinesin-like protein n=1 Tax=Hibiscus syriacus TaxID=106335 RepID=A0A6A2WVK6_HIBSY|nr:kinesin-like protein KIN-13B [Hibiscus syriacus]XP_039043140.1 kinesin-like protein KIN-13B [Hibiscus syriacus]XP_039043141.1 kinesin-like protein KIN-13B [Hibiscus syriacus]KAE8665378.1 Kinesin-like protein KIF2C [Hibiscus syriacus]
MSLVGRQMARSNSTAYHQRQYSDNFPEASFNAKWLQSSNLPSSQEFGFYGGGRMNRKSPEPGTPPLSSRSSSLRKNSDEYVSPSELSSGLLDLHSFDTELLSEVPNLYEGYGLQKPIRGKKFDDSEPYVSTIKLPNRPLGMAENSLLKSIAVDKERSNNVAKIKVVVRKRPLNKKEIAKKEEDIITIDSSALMVHEKKLKVDLTEYVEKHEFLFDAVLNEDVSNEEVYSKTVEPIVPLIFNRTKATCFAYGQTGSGKTYTMQPLPLKASQDIFRLMYHTYRNQGFQLFVSYFEIYGGKVFDLLNDRKKLCMREDGKQQVCIVGLQEYKVLDVQTIKELIERGNATRSTGTTGANEESSRSHAILQLAIKRSADGSELKPARLVGKLSFIDLAGSERGADTTDNDKQTRMEGAEINKSLLALKECIRALDNDQGHIPFRGSKLTEVLRDSFMGDSRTVMISCISPSSGSCEHTLNTLRYADRVKSLSKGNNSKKDMLPSSSNLRESTALPLSSSLPSDAFEDSITDIPFEKNKYGWSKPTERDISFKMDSVPSGRDTNLAVPYSDYVNGQRGGLNSMTEDDFDYFEETYEQPKMLQKRKDDLTKLVDPSTFDYSNSDDDLSALLKEEEDLVSAHRRQVEDTMELVREEMNLLVEADQAGNQLDDYISKLDTILSQKAAGIVQLQARLAQFQKHLKDSNVLVSSGN